MTDKEVIYKIIDLIGSNLDDLEFTVQLLCKLIANLKKVIEYSEDIK